MSPMLDDDQPKTVHHRPARPTVRRQALDEACGRRRRRTRERGQ